MNTQERMDEALDQFNDDAGKTTTTTTTQQTTKPHRSSQRKESRGRNRKLSKNESLQTLTPLPAPTKKGRDESAMESNWGMGDGVESTQVNNGGRKVRQYRMTIVGYSRVGKSALCSRFCDDSFKNDHPKHKELLFKKIIDLPEMPTYRFFLDILGMSFVIIEQLIHYL